MRPFCVRRHVCVRVSHASVYSWSRLVAINSCSMSQTQLRDSFTSTIHHYGPHISFKSAMAPKFQFKKKIHLTELLINFLYSSVDLTIEPSLLFIYLYFIFEFSLTSSLTHFLLVLHDQLVCFYIFVFITYFYLEKRSSSSGNYFDISVAQNQTVQWIFFNSSRVNIALDKCAGLINTFSACLSHSHFLSQNRARRAFLAAVEWPERLLLRTDFRLVDLLWFEFLFLSLILLLLSIDIKWTHHWIYI